MTISILVAVIVVIGVGVGFWIIRDPTGMPHSTKRSAVAPQRFDTTGGQEMRPLEPEREAGR